MYEEDLTYQEINNDGYFDFACKNGHECFIVLQEAPFELLFQAGVVSFCIDDYRSAVFNFASAFERYLEFCIKVFIFSDGRTHDLFNEVWKGVANQSERQLGAYYFLYYQLLHSSPKRLDDKMSNIRNRVIHKGEFPSQNDAMQYGNYVYSYVCDTLDVFQDNLNDRWHIGKGLAINHHCANSHSKLDKSQPNKKVVAMSIPTYMSLSRPMTMSFDEIISDYQSFKVKLTK